MSITVYQNSGKRGTDLVFSSLGIILLWPIFLVVAIFIKLDSAGPVFFRQKRVGKKGKVFTFYKFRNMVKDAEKLKKKYLHLNEANGPVFKIRDDPRYTRVGKFLSHTGLDELPQFINVVKGDMSLVGPRPLPVNEEGQIPVRWQKKRRLAKPGIACSWLLEGAHNLSFNQWMKLDLIDIKKSSLIYDFRMFLRVIILGLKFVSMEIRARNTIQAITNFLFLNLAYFLGIGITSIIAKVVGKHFLEMEAKKTSWQKYSKSKDLKTMY